MARSLPWLVIVSLAVLASLGPAVLRPAEARGLHGRYSRQTMRLCSRSLSEGLELLCKDLGGFNGPFDVERANGPGLVEECCHNACTIEQMKLYCVGGSKA